MWRFLTKRGQLGPGDTNLTFLTKGVHLRLRVTNVTFFNQRRSVGTPPGNGNIHFLKMVSWDPCGLRIIFNSQRRSLGIPFGNENLHLLKKVSLRLPLEKDDHFLKKPTWRPMWGTKNEQFLKLCLFICVSHLLCLKIVKVEFEWVSNLSWALGVGRETLRTPQNVTARNVSWPDDPV